MKKCIVIVLLVALCVVAYAQTTPQPAAKPAPVAQQQIKPLLGLLKPLPGQWTQAFQNEPVGQVIIVYNIADAQQQIANLTAENRALAKRVADLEKKLSPTEKPIDANKEPVDKVDGKK
ncbi:MAG: hypothetical protein LLG01_00645 [Planctomycetaceae bacterium]|nr:hypothetical protein [Planctomycetaceae bacterium]